MKATILVSIISICGVYETTGFIWEILFGTAYQFILSGKNFVVALRLQTQNGVGIFRRDSWKDAIPTAYFWH